MNKDFLHTWSKPEKLLLATCIVLIFFMFLLPLALLPLHKQSTTHSILSKNDTAINLGTIRTSFPGASKRIIVLSIEIVPVHNDRDFRDEILIKKNQLKAAALAFVQERAKVGTKNELLPLLTAGLTDTLNTQLYLGKIEYVVLKNFEIIE